MLDDKTSLIRKLIWHANHAGRMRQPEIRALLGFALEAVEDISSKHSERREVWEAKTYVAAVIGCRHPIHDQDAKRHSYWRPTLSGQSESRASEHNE
ncbi:hypothetical protein DOU54_26200 [Agrobacterium sp. MS2]|nr:hypothetical protein DOU54_26200 [Agrobacterium sp. MS2]